MVNLDMITKNPAHMAIAAGAVVLAVSVISKGKNVAGVKKKTVQYLGGALIAGGLGYKYVLKKGNGGSTPPIILPAPAAPTIPAAGPMPVGPVPTLPQVPGNLTSPGPTIGGTPGMPGPILSNYSRSRVANAARKAHFANSNTLGVFYNDVA